MYDVKDLFPECEGYERASGTVATVDDEVVLPDVDVLKV